MSTMTLHKASDILMKSPKVAQRPELMAVLQSELEKVNSTVHDVKRHVQNDDPTG